ncbi:hypothetical protein [Burkholderia sp. PU8-34]
MDFDVELEVSEENKPAAQALAGDSDICFHVKLCWVTGVCPLCSLVRVTGHFSDSPVSSIKTIRHPSQRAYF